ncbi:MdpB Microcystin-dependent protein [uncultured Caudovirales phage]|uniref:MdpB Microcystin-dependent protein n=1 Tax=uncultured Caudovirales phage TaxID=2100421 RepID=A0A6J5P8J1_9CAUD|nr:MdpB Microcystin-dependent protein [uncultured Caudovirales phage]
MPNPIKPKRSYTAAAVPAAVTGGEISVNAADGKIYLTNAAGTAQILVSSLARSDHTGTLAITSGGTGQTTANAAANAILPAQASNSGKYLTTNGTDSSWGSVTEGTTLPAGSMQMFAGAVTQSAAAGVVTTTAPSGWLLANGNIVSRSTYSALFSAIGTVFGSGDGSTTFALPDMRSRVPVGVGQASGLTNRTLGGTVGEENTTVGATNLPSHSHTFNPTGTLNTESSHTHASPNAGFHAHGSNVNVLCLAAGGANLNSGTTFQHYNLNQIMYGAGDHNHGNTNVNSGHTHTFTPTANQTTGNGPGTGASLTNMQPSIGINYIIKI